MLQHTVDWDIHLDPYVLSTMRCHLDVWMSGNRVYIAISKYSLHPKKTSHSRIQNLSPKTSHLTVFRKCMHMQESINAKYG